MAKALRHVGIVVSNLEKALDIYTNYLGCELIKKYPMMEGDYLSSLVGLNNVRMGVAILRTKDNNRIELLEYYSHPGKKEKLLCANNLGVSHFSLTVEDIQHLYQRRLEYDVKFISPPQKSPDGFVKVAYVVIMDESIVELVEVLDPRTTFTGGA